MRRLPRQRQVGVEWEEHSYTKARTENSSTFPSEKAATVRKSDAADDDTDAAQDDVEDMMDSDDEVEEQEMYFQQPQQLMTIFSELEENNLSLIQSCQETEETLEELRKNIAEAELHM